MYADQFYDGVDNIQAATPVDVESGRTTEGIDARFVTPGYKVSNLTISPSPLQSEGPTAAPRERFRDIDVDVTSLEERNSGAQLRILAIADTTKDEYEIGSWSLSLSAGETAHESIRWNTTGFLGDVTIIAEVGGGRFNWIRFASESVRTSVVVGGIGAGVHVPPSV